MMGRVSGPEMPRSASGTRAKIAKTAKTPLYAAWNRMERMMREPPSLRLTPRCGAKRRDGLPCQKPRAKGRSSCRLHGGAPGSGAPRGEANGRYSHGLLTAEAIKERNALSTIFERRGK